MAKRYGGKYSQDKPGGATRSAQKEARSEARRVDAAGARASVLFVPGIVLAFISLNKGASLLVLGLSGAAILTLAAWLTREGLRAHAEYDARKMARKPAIPRKVFGAVLTGVGIATAASLHGAGLVPAGLYGIAASALHLAAFGPDPMRDKRVEGIDAFQQDRVARVVEEAEGYLAAMRDQIAILRDRRLDGRVEQFQSVARRMIRTVEEDPRDLTGARKYLGVYLMGARDAAAKFSEHYRRTGEAAALAEFEALLVDLEENFAARTEKMLLDDRSDMEIEIKVLRDRLQREGL